MTDPFLALARRELADMKLWGVTCERAILSGAWDNGALVRERHDALLKARPEARDE